MCVLCHTVDLRATPLTTLAVLADEPQSCPRFKADVEAELLERMAGLDISDPTDEHL